MADNSVTIIIRDLTTGAGRTGLSVKLRHVTDSYASDIYTASAMSGKPGAYEAQDVVYNKYKIWVNGVEDTTFGGGKGRWLPPEGGEVIRLVSGEWDALDTKMVNLGNAVDATDALNMQTGDSRYLPASADSDYVKLVGDQDVEGTKTFKDDIKTDYIYEDTANAGVTFPDDPTTVGTLALTQIGSNFSLAGYYMTSLPTPVTGSGAANKTYVDTAVAGVVITPYQESPNVIRCIPGGTEKTGQVYTTYANSLQYALAVAGIDHRMTIKFDGMGTAGYNYINMSNAGGDYIDDYIHLKAINQDILLIPPATDVIGVGTLGNSIIENFTIYKDDSGVDVGFENIQFNNCSFNLTVLTATFTNCRFKNCDIIVNDDGDGTATFTNCKGRADSNQSFGTSTIDGQQNKPKLDF